MREFEYTIADKLGVHARPAGVFSKIAKSFSSEVTVSKGDKTINASKLLALMSLGIKYGDTIKVRVEGVDEEQAESEIKKFLSENL